MLVWNWYSTCMVLAFRFVEIWAIVLNLWGGGEDSQDVFFVLPNILG